MYNQFFAVGEETTWGTAATRNKFAKIHSGTELEHVADRQKSAKMAANAGADAESNFDRGQSGSGKIVIPMSYDCGAGFKIMKHLFGRVASTSGAGPYTHVLDRFIGSTFPGGAVNAAVGLSLEENYELPDAGPLESRLVTGAVVQQGTFMFNVGEEFVLDAEVLGKEQTQVIKTASPTYPDYNTYEMKYQHAALSIGGTAFGAVCSGFDLTINNNYETRNRFGSIYTQKPLRRGTSTISGNLRIDWEASPSAKGLWDAFKANTETSIIVTLTSGSYSFALRCESAKFDSSKLSPEEGQIQQVSFPFSVYHNATHSAVKATIITPNATI